ncbi:hypothetical protein [Fimbriiglobus ruber]|nr:hypothetical protein [Fimbriiglobus ruber]
MNAADLETLSNGLSALNGVIVGLSANATDGDVIRERTHETCEKMCEVLKKYSPASAGWVCESPDKEPATKPSANSRTVTPKEAGEILRTDRDHHFAGASSDYESEAYRLAADMLTGKWATCDRDREPVILRGGKIMTQTSRIILQAVALAGKGIMLPVVTFPA